IKRLVESGQSPREIIEGLFLLTLSRRPTNQELTELVELAGAESNHQSVYQDIFWGLLNSTEFAFNH
ncbi:MAG: hypothetical protein VB858_06975, partial [Planctomycetaceae bacterium]